MSKLSELAELLNSSKKPVVVEETVKPAPAPVIVQSQPSVVVPEQPIIVQQLTKDIANLKRMIDELSKQQSSHRYNPVAFSGGGGADSMADIRRPIKAVSSNYTPTTRDWYIGVNHSSIVTITLPLNVENGREYVIKDEAGIASNVPIKIQGNIDSNADGIELRISNGSITVMYHNGWRII
jgi:hypothetical protein